MQFHGSHPEHPFSVLEPGMVADRCCSICRSTACGFDVLWYRCCSPTCAKMLCNKCFEVNEQLLGSRQVVLRNPLLSHDNDAVCVHTRPRASSHKLAPLYPAKLMEVVSSAISLDDPNQRYFRLSRGGWINATHVVCVIPAEGFIQELCNIHRMDAHAAEEGSVARANVSVGTLRSFLHESLALLKSSPEYGIVMAALTFYPLLSTVSRPEPESTDPEMASTLVRLRRDIVTFVYECFTYAESQLANFFTLHDAGAVSTYGGTLLPFYVDFLARSLLVTQDFFERWNGTLLDSHIQYLQRCIILFGRLHHVLRDSFGPAEITSMCAPAFITCHVDLKLERQRVRSLCNMMMEASWRLLQRAFPAHHITQRILEPIRAQLSLSYSEVFAKVFCEMLTVYVSQLPSHRAHFLDFDPFEVLNRLGDKGTLTERQVAIFKLVSNAARDTPKNIILITSIMQHTLMHLASVPGTPAAATAALDCFYELAFNDPAPGADSISSQKSPNTPYRGGGGSGGGDAAHCCSCTAAQYPSAAPFQRIQVFQLPSFMVYGVCMDCAAHHMPAGVHRVGEPLYMHFRCQCPCNGATERDMQGGSVLHAQQSCLPPEFPPALATHTFMSLGLPVAIENIIRLYREVPAVMNSVGRLALRMPLPENIMCALLEAIAHQQQLSLFNIAAMAIGGSSFLPSIIELRERIANTSLGRYLEEPCPVNYTPVKLYRHDETPTYSSMKSELGLSASPDFNSVGRIGDSSEMRSRRAGSLPVVNLFSSATAVL